MLPFEDRVIRTHKEVQASNLHPVMRALKNPLDAALPDGHENHIPSAHFGPLACGEKVVASTEMIARLLRECPQLLGVAMEAAGVAVAVGNVGLDFLEIRGVSDVADF
jgi:nucleoside phosphorylase